MRLNFLIVLLILTCSSTFGQQISQVLQGNSKDSSFYHLEKINDNEFWVGGEYGILKKIDSLGNISPLNFPNQGHSILKIVAAGDYIFLVTDNAVIYRYDPIKRTFLKKEFSNFDKKCFYDIIPLKSGKLLLCGGTTGIAAGEKKIPHGFIATIDLDLEQIDIIWKKQWKFVWSLLELDNGKIIAASFNGLNTKIISSDNLVDWQKDSKIKGLVHELAFLNNKIWYSGAKSIRYKKHGILGMKDQKQLQSKNTGCLWSMEEIDGKIISTTSTSNLAIIDNSTGRLNHIKIPSPYFFFDIEKISKSKIMIVGHGKSIYIVDL